MIVRGLGSSSMRYLLASSLTAAASCAVGLHALGWSDTTAEGIIVCVIAGLFAALAVNELAGRLASLDSMGWA